MEERQKSRGTIIVLEDSDPARNVVTFFLEKNGYSTKGYPNGKAALADLEKAEINDLKLILTDIMMPELDGFSFVRKIKELNMFPGVPILIMSALSEKDSILEAKKIGVSGYILKPISVKKLIEVLKKLFPNEIFKDLNAKY